MEEKKCYIIVTENNYWASSLFDVTAKELVDEIAIVRENLKDIGEDKDAELYAYEINRTPITFKA